MEPQIQRWSAKRKVELLLQLIRGEKKLVDVCREHDLKQSEVEAWMDTFLKAGERGLKAQAEDESAVARAGGEGAARQGRRAGAGAGRPKKMGGSQRPGRDGLLTLQSEMRAEGNEVSIASSAGGSACRARRFYYTAAGAPAAAGDRRGGLRTGPRRSSRPIRRTACGASRPSCGAKAKPPVNRKKVHRIVKLNGWQVWQKPQGKRPRVQGWTSRASHAE